MPRGRAAAAAAVRRSCCSSQKLLLAVSSGVAARVRRCAVERQFVAVDGSAVSGLRCDGTGQNGRERLEVSRRGKQESGGVTRTGESASTAPG